MDAPAQEAALKKKLQVFLSDLQHMGTVAGFRHFSSYVRGREEIVVAINNTLQGAPAGDLSVPASRRESVCQPGDSLTSSQLPYDKGSLVLSHNTQLGLSGRREKGVGLPPASPSEEESGTDQDKTLLLVAGYGRYSCPYVWVRSHHERLFKISGEQDNDRDSPLRLKSTAKWKDADVSASDIIAELVRLCTYPAPRNPFEVDLQYFQSLPQPEQLLASAAMVSLLQKIVVHTPDSKAYAGKVSEDLQLMSRLHFSSLQHLTEEQSIAALKQAQRQPQPQQQHGIRYRRQQQQQQPPPPKVASSQQQQQWQQPPPHQQQIQQPPPLKPAQQQQQQQQPPPPKIVLQQPQQPQQQQQQYHPQRFRYPQPTQQQPQAPPLNTPSQQPQQQQQRQQYQPQRYRYPQPTQQQQQPPQQQYRHPQPSQRQPLPPPPSQNSQPPQMQPPASVQQQQPPPPVSGVFKPAPSSTGYSYYNNPQEAQSNSQQGPLTNPTATRVYGRGPRGAYPGGFERMPAPSLF